MENGVSIQNLRIFAEMYNFAYNVKKLEFYYTVEGASHFVHEPNYAHPLPRGVSGPVPSRVIKRKKTPCRCLFRFRAGKGTRTLDPDLGKVVLYQLSYSRG